MELLAGVGTKRVAELPVMLLNFVRYGFFLNAVSWAAVST